LLINAIEYTGLALVLFSLCIISLFCPSAEGNSVSATGAAFLTGVPLGRDSTYQTEIVGVNGDSVYTSCFRFEIISGANGQFFEPIPKLAWLSVLHDTLCAGPLSSTRPVRIITTIPSDTNLYNRRFGANVRVGKGSQGGISIKIQLNVFIETESSTELHSGGDMLQIAPICKILDTTWDSIAVFNDSRETDTVRIFWAKDLSGLPGENSDIEIARKLFLWQIPTSSIILEPNEKEWIYFKKAIDYQGPDGYIVCIGRCKSLYCDLNSTRGDI